VHEEEETHRCLTQSPHREPPYARFTDFWRFEMVAYWRGRSAGIWNKTYISIIIKTKV
jgi:hypothetical protein